MQICLNNSLPRRGRLCRTWASADSSCLAMLTVVLFSDSCAFLCWQWH